MNSSDVLAHGSFGTTVFKVTLKDGRDVAVKKLKTCEISEKEVDTLLKLSKEKYSPNIVRYYLSTKDAHHTYIVIELCEGTLKDFLLGRAGLPECVLAAKDILKGIISGLVYLHSHKIIHRDIKPENILVSYPMAEGRRRIMLSDLGLARRLSSVDRVVDPCGTIGWMAPEVFDASVEKTPDASFKSDIFSAGCVFFFALTKGRHPFGDVTNLRICQENIANNNFLVSLEFSEIVMEKYKDILLTDLIESMIRRDWKARSDALEVDDHPYFWDAKKTLEYFHRISNFCDTKDEDTKSFLEELEKNALDVIGKGVDGKDGDWLSKLDKEVKKDAGWLKDRSKELYGLVKMIRNKEEHYAKLGDKLKEKYGKYPEGFLHYFTSRFPHLVAEAYKAFKPYDKER